MEPANLRGNSPDDEQLDAWLRAQSSVSPLPDAGFSQRVLATLPPQASAHAPAQVRSALRGWLLLAGLLAGGVMVFSSRSEPANISEKFAALLPSLQTAAKSFSDPAVALALIVTGASLAFVYRREIARKVAAGL